jgi:hypothetical protein
MNSRRAAGPAYGRRNRLLLAGGALAFVGVALLFVLARPRPAPYVPGTDAANSAEITRSLERPVTPASAGNGAVPPAAEMQVRFTDAAEAAGIRFRHFHGRRSTQLPEDMGSGAAWGDFDGDGDPDLFLVNATGPLTASESEHARSPARSALYRNDGGGRFTDVTEAAGASVRGLGMAAAWGDYDGDHDLDLFVTRFGTNVLLRNEGGARFTDVSAAAGVAGVTGFWSGASWADYDKDGDLDLYVCGYVRYEPPRGDLAHVMTSQFKSLVPFTLNPSSYAPERNLLYRNDGSVFREVAREAGVANPEGRSLSASWSDFDRDGWPDLYVANDVSDNAMFRNEGYGRFRDVSHSAWVADYRGAMGLGIGDWDNDLDFDIFVTHWIAQENAIYVNEKGRLKTSADAPLRFVDQADVLGLGHIALDKIGWGTFFFDYDNDGRLDLFVANGSTFQKDSDPSRLVPMRNQLFWNAGEVGFYEVGERSGAPFAVENVGRGAAFADYDADGDLDIALTTNGGAARLLRNDGGNASHWLRVVLRGAGSSPRGAGGRAPRTSTYATGALVQICAGSLRQLREVGDASSYLSQAPPGEAFFGLGSATTVDSLEVVWPSGQRQVFQGLPARATLLLTEGEPPIVSPASQP